MEGYLAGLGERRPSSVFPGVQETVLPVFARINGIEVTVLFAGAAPGFAGLNQVNVLLPRGLAAGLHRLEISSGGGRSNVVLLPVQ